MIFRAGAPLPAGSACAFSNCSDVLSGASGLRSSCAMVPTNRCWSSSSAAFLRSAFSRKPMRPPGQQRCVARPKRRIQLLQPRHLRLGVFLKEKLAFDAIRCADQRHGPAFQVRQHALGNAVVVVHQVELLQARGRVDDAIRVGDLDGPRGTSPRRHLRWRHAALSPDGVGGLVGAPAFERRMAHMAVRGPFREADLGHQRRLGPMLAPCGSLRPAAWLRALRVEWRTLDLEL